jgi:hypothetical protein
VKFVLTNRVYGCNLVVLFELEFCRIQPNEVNT